MKSYPKSLLSVGEVTISFYFTTLGDFWILYTKYESFGHWTFGLLYDIVYLFYSFNCQVFVVIFFIGVWLIYNIVLVSSIQQSDSVIHNI